MFKGMQIISGVIFFIGTLFLSSGICQESGSSVPFSAANVRFEQNATDGDVEVVFEVKGGDEGLANLTVVSPDGRTIIEFRAPDASNLGIRQFRFESPEPTDVESMKAAYPEGGYKISGTSATGEEFYSEVTLNHELPATTSFKVPAADAEGVGIKDQVITWTPVKNIAAYMINLEQEEQNLNVTARLAGSVNQFAVPEGFLHANSEYKLGIGTVSEAGNISFIETSFTTAE
jgi:hypothetical protein